MVFRSPRNWTAQTADGSNGSGITTAVSILPQTLSAQPIASTPHSRRAATSIRTQMGLSIVWISLRYPQETFRHVRVTHKSSAFRRASPLVPARVQVLVQAPALLPARARSSASRQLWAVDRPTRLCSPAVLIAACSMTQMVSPSPARGISLRSRRRVALTRASSAWVDTPTLSREHLILPVDYHRRRFLADSFIP